VFGQDDEDEEENEAEKDAAAKAKAGQKPPGFVQAFTTATTASTTATLAKSPAAKATQEQEGTLYIRDAKARRKKEMDDHLEAIKRYRKEITLMCGENYILIIRRFLTAFLLQPGKTKQ
jgi:U2-associated protein SR140